MEIKPLESRGRDHLKVYILKPGSKVNDCIVGPREDITKGQRN